MAGYWPSSFFARVCGDGVELHNLAKKRTRPISSHLDRLVNKGVIIWLSGKFFLRDTAVVVPSGQDSSILPARVATDSEGFD